MKKITFLVLLSVVFLSCKKDSNPVKEEPASTNNLLLYMPFNGNANDESGNNNNASNINASLTTDRFGKSDSAYYFNGIDSYIEIPNSSSLASPKDSITICAWVYINNWYSSKWAPICGKTNTSSYAMYGINLTNFTSTKQIEFQLNYGYRKYDYSFNTGQWYFIVTTWNGSYCNYYVNGAYLGSLAYSGSINPDSRPLVLGAETSEVTEYLDGKLDDIRIYDYAVSGQFVDSLYNIDGW